MSIKDKIKSAKPTQFFDDETVDGWSEWLEEHDKQIRAEAYEECARIIENSKTLFENHQTETIMATKDKCIAMIRNLREKNNESM